MAFKNPGTIGENYSAWVEELKQAKAIFDSAGVKYWLDMGTILGAMRNGEMILWDNDIDFSAEVTEATKVISTIPEFVKRGYQVIVTDAEIYFNTPEHISIGMAFYRVTNDKVWIIWLETHSKLKFITRHFKRVAERMLYRDFHHGLHKAEENFYKLIPQKLLKPIRKLLWQLCYLSGSRNYPMVFPRTMMNDLESVNLCGLEFKAPHPAEKYIQLIYGPNWQVPDKSWRWDQVEAINRSFFDQKSRDRFNLLDYLPDGK